MKSKRTSAAFLLAAFGGLLLFANCTVKTVDGGDTCSPGQKSTCECSSSLKGNQTCSSKGTWGVCECGSDTTNGGSSNNVGGEGNTSGTANKAGSDSGGTTSNGGTTGYAGEPTAGGEAPMSGGAGGEGPVAAQSCDECVIANCPDQWDACAADEQCLSKAIDGSGQWELIGDCIQKGRAQGLVKRDVVRGCGVNIGGEPTAEVVAAWPPQDMDPVTADLMNCMAGGNPMMPNGDWADINNDKSFMLDQNNMLQPLPWGDGTCAKLACTSSLKQ